MKKFLKWFLGIAAVGSVIGILIAYFCKNDGYDICDESDDDGDDFELDDDLKPAKDRGYVHLKRTADNTKKAEDDAEKAAGAKEGEEPAAAENADEAVKAEETAADGTEKAEEEEKQQETN